jgi:hypothetical protein
MPPQHFQHIALTIALVMSAQPDFSAQPRPGQNPPSQTPEWSHWIELVRKRALEYSDSLPDFICAQTTRRYSSTSDIGTWQPDDVWEAELSFNQKVERYSNVRLNGKPSRKPLESLGGALSIGEFGSLLRTLFLPKLRRNSQEGEGGQEPQSSQDSIYRERSRWALSFRIRTLNVAFHGKIWLDASNYQVLRISQEARDFPAKFPIAYSEATTVYGYVSVAGLEGKSFLLPQSAHLVLHEREGRVRSLNVIEFRNYRKFTADVRLVPE